MKEDRHDGLGMGPEACDGGSRACPTFPFTALRNEKLGKIEKPRRRITAVCEVLALSSTIQCAGIFCATSSPGFRPTIQTFFMKISKIPAKLLCSVHPPPSPSPRAGCCTVHLGRSRTDSCRYHISTSPVTHPCMNHRITALGQFSDQDRIPIRNRNTQIPHCISHLDPDRRQPQ